MSAKPLVAQPDIDSIGAQVNLSRSVAIRVANGALGFVFLAVGIAGYWLPGLPGTVNLIIAAYFFSMSNERMFRWMMTNRWFGQHLLDYRAGLGIPRRYKIAAVASIVLSVAASVVFAISNPWARFGLVLFGLYGVWFVLGRPTKEIEVLRRANSSD